MEYEYKQNIRNNVLPHGIAGKMENKIIPEMTCDVLTVSRVQYVLRFQRKDNQNLFYYQSECYSICAIVTLTATAPHLSSSLK